MTRAVGSIPSGIHPEVKLPAARLLPVTAVSNQRFQETDGKSWGGSVYTVSRNLNSGGGADLLTSSELKDLKRSSVVT